MNPINYFEGLPGVGDGAGADLDPERVASVEDMARAEERLLEIAARMAIVRLAAETRRALGVVVTAEAADVMLACAELVQDDPSLADEAGDSAEDWAQVTAAALAYGDAAAAIAPLLSQARANEAVLLSALSGDVVTVTGAVQRRTGDEGTPLADRDVLRYRFARIDEEDRLARSGQKARAARGARRSQGGEEELRRIEGDVDAVLRGIAVKQQLGRGQVPGLADPTE